MRLHGSVTFNGREYVAGDEISPLVVYPFFLLHMAIIGVGIGFFFAYVPDSSTWQDPVFAASVVGSGILGAAIYLLFYLRIFGRDEVEWMIINAGLGLIGTVSQLDWILSLFGKGVGDYPPYVHLVPLLYFVMYTFLLRRAVLQLFGVDEDEEKRPKVGYGFAVAMLAFYLVTHLLEG
jgi:hypothetical protein